MCNSIKISIIIPAYNVESYIERSISSAINQTLKDIEIIVVNDGSTDNTRQIIENLSQKDKRIIVINKKNEGLLFARQTGLKIAKGTYIQALDADDWIEKDACAKLYNFAQKNSLDIVISNFYRDDDNGNIEIIFDLNNQTSIYSGTQYLYKYFQGESHNAVWNKLFHKELFKNVIFPPNINLGEDLFTTVVLASKAKKIGKYPETFLHYIQNPDSITNQKKSKNMHQIFKAYRAIEENLKKDNNYEQYAHYLYLVQYKTVTSFLSQVPYFNSNEYEKGINEILSFLKSNPTIPKKISFMKKVLLTLLVKELNRNNLIRIVKMSNLLLKFRIV